MPKNSGRSRKNYENSIRTAKRLEKGEIGIRKTQLILNIEKW